MQKLRIPKYAKHKSGQARVRFPAPIGDIYLGEYDTPESRTKYDKLIADYLAGRPIEKPEPAKRGPRQDNNVPALCRHAATGRGYSTVQGRPIYFGGYGTEECQQRYAAFVAEWLANNRILPGKYQNTERKWIEVGAKEYLLFIAGEYANRPESAEWAVIKSVLDLVIAKYGHATYTEFGIAEAKAIRQGMVEKGWKRKSINKKMGRLRAFLKWSIEQGYYDKERLEQIAEMKPLAKGKAVEGKPVRPVKYQFVAAVLDELPSPVRSVIELQTLTAARPGEWLIARPVDIRRIPNAKTGEEDWVYCPYQHKNLHRQDGGGVGDPTEEVEEKDITEFSRWIPVPPKARAVLEPFLNRGKYEYLFSPKEAVAEYAARKRANRKTPMYPSHAKRLAVMAQRVASGVGKRRPGDHYMTNTYRNAIHRACDKVDAAEHRKRPTEPWDGKKIRHVPRWNPNQLRHLAATLASLNAGLHAAQNLLGHTTPEMTGRYVLGNKQTPSEAARARVHELIEAAKGAAASL